VSTARGFPAAAAACPPYEELGTRDPDRLVVYLHEAGLDIRSARHLPTIRALAHRGAWVVLPELPLHGARLGAESGGYDRERDRLWVVEAASREVGQLLASLAASTCTVVGGSLGGLCALAAAVRLPQIRRVSSFLAPFGWRRGWRWARSAGLLACDPARNVHTLLDRDVLQVFGQYDRWAKPPAARVCDPTRWTAAGGRLSTVVLPGHGHRHSAVIAATVAEWYGDGRTGPDANLCRMARP
jgi:pimeloyl-ACP methyl ester carboxylesterase